MFQLANNHCNNDPKGNFFWPDSEGICICINITLQKMQPRCNLNYAILNTSGDQRPSFHFLCILSIRITSEKLSTSRYKPKRTQDTYKSNNRENPVNHHSNHFKFRQTFNQILDYLYPQVPK